VQSLTNRLTGTTGERREEKRGPKSRRNGRRGGSLPLTGPRTYGRIVVTGPGRGRKEKEDQAGGGGKIQGGQTGRGEKNRRCL